MKSISSQLNRGTELLKQTVQRAIFSSKSGPSGGALLEPPTTAKPTPYHSDPHAVTRSSSVDSLHQETCHIRPIRAYSLTPFRRGASLLNCPLVVRPGGELVIKYFPVKVKGTFKLQKVGVGSAFCSLGTPIPSESPETSASKKGGRTSKKAAGGKRKRKEVEEDEPVEAEVAPKRGKTATKASNTRKPTQRKTASKSKTSQKERQEREDFELAKRLQKELNSSNDSGLSNGTCTTTSTRRTRNGQSLNNSSVSNYSLRTTRSLSKSVSHPSLSPSVGVSLDDAPKGKEERKTTNGLSSRNRNGARKRNAVESAAAVEVTPVESPKKTRARRGGTRSTKRLT